MLATANTQPFSDDEVLARRPTRAEDGRPHYVETGSGGRARRRRHDSGRGERGRGPAARRYARAPGHDLSRPAQPELPPVLERPARLAHRRVDAADGDGLAGDPG